MTKETDIHPISLREIFFLRSTVVAIPGHEPSEERKTAPPVNNIHVEKIDGEPGVYTAVMRTVVNQEMDKGSPYFVDMECLAVLHADPSLSQEDAKKGITITAHSVLYGAIREAVAWISGRQPYGPLLLGLSILKPKKKADQPETAKT